MHGQKSRKECQTAFDNLKGKLVTAPVLAFPNFDKSFVIDASIKGLGAVLSQQQEDGQMHPVAFASRALSQQEKNYSVTDLETLAVVWAVSHFHVYLYGHDVEVRTDHSTVKAVLSAPSPNGKHARWWSKVYSSGVRAVTIIHRAGKKNLNADTLSRNPHGPPPVSGIGEGEVQVAVITNDSTTLVPDSEMNITDMLNLEPVNDNEDQPNNFSQQQQKDKSVLEMIDFLKDGKLPSDQQQAKKVELQDSKNGNRKRAVVPKQLQKDVVWNSQKRCQASS